MESQQHNTLATESSSTSTQHQPPGPISESRRPAKGRLQKGLAADGNCQFNGEDYPTWLGFEPQKPGSGFKNPLLPPIDRDVDAWEEAMHTIQKEDDAICDAWNAEIQNLLIFSGLFSAVITAFAVETQMLLQEDAEVTTVLLLAEFGSHFLPNSTNIKKIAATFRTSVSMSESLLINGLIFSSLVLSLGTALIGIIVLQWIRSYRAPESSYDSTKFILRQARHGALNKWKVPTFVAYLPVCLGLAFFIFLLGLGLFLKSLNNTLGNVIGSMIFLIYFFLVITTILPALQISMLFCKMATKYTSIRDWPDLISRLYKDRSTHRNRARWLKDAVVSIFQRVNSAKSFHIAYHCFQSIPKHISDTLDLRLTIVSEVLRNSEELRDTGAAILASIQSSYSPIVCNEFLSLLLLLWNSYSDPSYAAHRGELYFRCIQTLSKLNGEAVKNQTYMDLINLWCHHSDSILCQAENAREWTSYLVTFLTALEANPSFGEKKQPLAFSLFWQLIASRMHDGSDQSLMVVQDCLRVLTSWLLKVQNSSDAEYKLFEDNQVLRHALQPMFDHDVFNQGPLITSLISQQPSRLLHFLDIFIDPSHIRLYQGWNDAIEGAWAESWNDFLVDTGLDDKYSKLKKPPTESYPHGPDLAPSLGESSTPPLLPASHSLDLPFTSPEPQDHPSDSTGGEADRLVEVITQGESVDPLSSPLQDLSMSRGQGGWHIASTTIKGSQMGQYTSLPLGPVTPSKRDRSAGESSSASGSTPGS